MPVMSKIVSKLTILFLSFSFIIAMWTHQYALGKSIVQIETGSHQSASWQFTIELSELWRKNFPELDTSLAPAHTADIEKRFENLQLKKIAVLLLRFLNILGRCPVINRVNN